MTTYRLFPSTNGPSVATSANTDWLSGVMFSVTGGVRWLDGYWWWVCNSGQTVTPQKFALWNRWGSSVGNETLVPGSVVTSGTLTAGQWNYVPLPAPIQLGPGALYVAATGWAATGIPLTSQQFGSVGPGPYVNGIVNGPLTAWSDSTNGGTNNYSSVPGAVVGSQIGQGLFTAGGGTDPSAAMPATVQNSDNFWIDIQIDDTAPSGYGGSYRFDPNMAELGNFTLDTANGFTLGKEFSLSRACAVTNGWFYSPAGVSQLPSKIGVYRVSDQVLIGVNNSPSWSGAAASGWISSPMPGVTLQAGVNYKYVVFQGSNVIWNAAVANYWATGFGANGLTSGPLTAPDNAGATPGQESYHQAATISYPDTGAGPFAYGLDLEVTPLAAAAGPSLLMASFP